MHRHDGGGCANDPAYMVFDSGFVMRYPLPGVPSGGPVPGWVARSGSPRGLAMSIGVDPDGLERTVAAWNKACADGHDEDFGRGDSAYDRYGGDPAIRPNPNLGPVDTPPFYAVIPELDVAAVLPEVEGEAKGRLRGVVHRQQAARKASRAPLG